MSPEETEELLEAKRELAEQIAKAREEMETARPFKKGELEW